jgi:hypothetical protein
MRLSHAKTVLLIGIVLAILGFSASATAAVPGGSQNDYFADRIPLSGSVVEFSGSTEGASHEENEPDHGDPSVSLVATGHSIWWSWIAPVTSSVTVFFIQEAGGFQPACIPVYTGSSFTQFNLVTKTSIPDVFPPSEFVTFNAIAGTSYQIAVDENQFNTSGQLNFVLRTTNDNFENRVPIDGLSASVTGSTVGATSELNEPALSSSSPAEIQNGRNTVWWTWLAPADGSVTIDSKDSDFNTLLHVFTG